VAEHVVAVRAGHEHESAVVFVGVVDAHPRSEAGLGMGLEEPKRVMRTRCSTGTAGARYEHCTSIRVLYV
jgi:hypothetical protein